MSNGYELNKNLTQMPKGGVIMDVTTPEQTKVAEEAGAYAVMALERIPAGIRTAGGVSRMSDLKMIRGIQWIVSIPVIAKAGIGHFVGTQILQVVEIDYVDESEALSPMNDPHHIDKTRSDVPFVCGTKNPGGALHRIAEGAPMVRIRGEPDIGDVVQTAHHMRLINRQIHEIRNTREDELLHTAKELQVPYEPVRNVFETGRLPIVNFVAGGTTTPADAALTVQLGAEGVLVDPDIFKSGNSAKGARAIVQAVMNYSDSVLLAELPEDLGEVMVGISEQEIKLLMAKHGI